MPSVLFSNKIGITDNAKVVCAFSHTILNEETLNIGSWNIGTLFPTTTTPVAKHDVIESRPHAFSFSPYLSQSPSVIVSSYIEMNI